jgi:hypothetical protein
MQQEIISANRKLTEILNQFDPKIGLSIMITRLVLWGRKNKKTKEQYLDMVTEAWDEINNLIDIELNKNTQSTE